MAAEYSEGKFVEVLKCNFLKEPRNKKYEDDIRFDPTGKKIIASRGVVVSRDVVDSNREKGIMVRAREVRFTPSSSLNFQVFL